MPALAAAAITGWKRSRLSAIDHLMLRLENVSEAAAKTAISLASAAAAPSKPRMFGTRTGYEVPGSCLIPAITSAASAICGTHLADTKLVASTAGKPLADS